MNQKEYLDFAQKTCAEMLQLIEKKNADYTNGSDSAFANFDVASDFGVDPLLGLCLRVSDKFQRIKSFAKKGELQVKGEPVEDAWRDLIGYSLVALAMLSEKKKTDKIEENGPGLWVGQTWRTRSNLEVVVAEIHDDGDFEAKDRFGRPLHYQAFRKQKEERLWVAEAPGVPELNISVRC